MTLTLPYSSPTLIGKSPMKDGNVDALLAQELNNMSLDERNRMWEEIHGVDKPIEETEELVTRSLRDMEEEICNIPVKAAYDRASESYKKDRKFRLMFLRCEYFDAKKAAVRLVKFMDGMLEYFGEVALTRPIRLSDFSSDDLAYFKLGTMQLLSKRDRAGRLVCCNLLYLLPKSYKEPESEFRALIYIAMSMLEDEETQRRGFVVLAYYVGDLKYDGESNKMLISGGMGILQWLPVRVASVHYCFSHPLIKPVASLFQSLMLSRLRQGARMRAHHGSDQECRYSLKTFGIPVDALPIAYDGTLKNTAHLKRLTRRRAIEKCRATQEKANPTTGSIDILNDGIIEFPANNDILCGRGKPMHKHPGNVMLRELVESMFSEYEGAAYGLKMTTHENVVKILTGKIGARFLTQESGGWWVEVPFEVAVEKVTHSFRTVALDNKTRKSRKKEDEAFTREKSKAEMDGPSKRARLEASKLDVSPAEDKCSFLF